MILKQRKIYLTKLLELLANCGGLRRSHHQQLTLLINNQMPTISTNKELLNVINEDVKNVKQFTKMPAISDELYNELLEEFNNDSYYFFN